MYKTIHLEADFRTMKLKMILNSELTAVILKADGKDVANLKIIQYNRSYEKLK